MKLQEAKSILSTLSQGIHPITGESMPQDSPYNTPPVIRALLVAVGALNEAIPTSREGGSDGVIRTMIRSELAVILAEHTTGQIVKQKMDGSLLDVIRDIVRESSSQERDEFDVRTIAKEAARDAAHEAIESIDYSTAINWNDRDIIRGVKQILEDNITFSVSVA